MEVLIPIFCGACGKRIGWIDPAEGIDIYGFCEDCAEEADDKLVGRFIIKAIHSDEVQGKESEALSNAALIASAPDLLEALRYVADVLDTARDYFPKSIRNSDRFDLENARATIGKAIAKAEGR